MDSQTLRTLVREVLRDVLADELPRLKKGHGATEGHGTGRQSRDRVEKVKVASNYDLAVLVKRILVLTQDEASRQGLADGSIRFELATSSDGQAAKHRNASGKNAHDSHAPSHRFDKGLISERQVDAIAPGTTVIQVAKGVRFTPLAQDRLRQKGIKVERTTT
ncbi:MAG: hypothetical protein AAF530_15405 [Pseudomonadota bacterium]